MTLGTPFDCLRGTNVLYKKNVNYVYCTWQGNELNSITITIPNGHQLKFNGKYRSLTRVISDFRKKPYPYHKCYLYWKRKKNTLLAFFNQNLMATDVPLSLSSLIFCKFPLSNYLYAYYVHQECKACKIISQRNRYHIKLLSSFPWAWTCNSSWGVASPK